jgi:hypothetical protein
MGNRRNRVRAILLRFDVDGDIQIVSASADDAYPGVSFTRTVAMMPGGIILDVCDLVSDSEHTYDWIYHNRGDFTTSLETRDLGGQLAEDSGYQNIQSVDVAETAHAWWASWVGRGCRHLSAHTRGDGNRSLHRCRMRESPTPDAPDGRRPKTHESNAIHQCSGSYFCGSGPATDFLGNRRCGSG